MNSFNEKLNDMDMYVFNIVVLLGMLVITAWCANEIIELLVELRGSML